MFLRIFFIKVGDDIGGFSVLVLGRRRVGYEWEIEVGSSLEYFFGILYVREFWEKVE